MRSRDKIVLDLFEKKPAEWWVRGFLYMRGQPTNEWIPSFEDLFRTLWAIAHCEIAKYTGKTPGDRSPVYLVRMCCKLALDAAERLGHWDSDAAHAAWEEAAPELKIPIRETPDYWPGPNGEALAPGPALDDSALARCHSAGAKCRMLARACADKDAFAALLREYQPDALKSPVALDYFWRSKDVA